MKNPASVEIFQPQCDHAKRDSVDQDVSDDVRPQVTAPEAKRGQSDRGRRDRDQLIGIH